MAASWKKLLEKAFIIVNEVDRQGGDLEGVALGGGRGSGPGSSQRIRSSQPSWFAAMRRARMSAHSEVLEVNVARAARNSWQQRS